MPGGDEIVQRVGRLGAEPAVERHDAARSAAAAVLRDMAVEVRALQVERQRGQHRLRRSVAPPVRRSPADRARFIGVGEGGVVERTVGLRRLQAVQGEDAIVLAAAGPDERWGLDRVWLLSARDAERGRARRDVEHVKTLAVHRPGAQRIGRQQSRAGRELAQRGRQILGADRVGDPTAALPARQVDRILEDADLNLRRPVDDHGLADRAGFSAEPGPPAQRWQLFFLGIHPSFSIYEPKATLP